MLDIGWSEMAMIALLALIVIGPKDLPRVMRTVGQWVRKARGFARDFQSSLDDMIQDEEIKEARRTIEEQTRKFNQRESHGIGAEVAKHLDSEGDLRNAARDVEETARGATPSDDADSVPRPGTGTRAGGGKTSGGEGAGMSGETESPEQGTEAGGSDGTTKATFVTHEAKVAPGHSVHAGKGGDGAGQSRSDASGTADSENGEPEARETETATGNTGRGA